MIFINSELYPDDNGFYKVNMFGVGRVARCKNLSSFLKYVNESGINFYASDLVNGKVGFRIIKISLDSSLQSGCLLSAVIQPCGEMVSEVLKALETPKLSLSIIPGFQDNDPTGVLNSILFTVDNYK